MIANIIPYVGGLATGVIFTLCYQQAQKSDAQAKRLDALKGNPTKRWQR